MPSITIKLLCPKVRLCSWAPTLGPTALVVQLKVNCRPSQSHFLCPKAVFRHCCRVTQLISWFYGLDTVIVPNLEIRKLRHREVKLLAHSHAAGKWQSRCLKTSSLAPQSMFLTSMLHSLSMFQVLSAVLVLLASTVTHSYPFFDIQLPHTQKSKLYRSSFPGTESP